MHMINPVSLADGFCTKLWFMSILVALESRSTDVEMDVREVREVSSTWTLREWGEFFDRT